MSFYFPNVDYTYIFKREGTNDDPFIFLKDENFVRKKALMLREIPSKEKGVVVKDSKDKKLEETNSDEPSNNQFRVDYSTGIIYFNSSRDGEQMVCEYTGMGSVFISAARVMMQGGEDDPLESLEELLSHVQEGVETLEQVGNLDFVGEYSDSHEYRKWNFVTYDNKTFVAIKNSTGVKPSESSHWRLVSSGVGFSGIFEEDKVYAIGDLVSDKEKKNLYISKKMDNDSSLDNSDDWDNIITLDDTIENMQTSIDEKINELNVVADKLISDDEKRDENEEERDSTLKDALAQLELFKDDLEEDESERVKNEALRNSSERERNSGEELRISNEADRKVSEKARESQEESREQEFNSALNKVNKSIEDVSEISSNASETLTEVEIIKNDVDTVLDDTESALNNINNFSHQEEFNIRNSYNKYNIVTQNGSSYIAIQDIEQDEDTEEEDIIDIDNDEYWRLIAEKGRDISELSIEGISPDEDGFISLETLGLATENSVHGMADEITEDYKGIIGELTDLRTTNKGSIVDAINELKGRIDELIDLIN